MAIRRIAKEYKDWCGRKAAGTDIITKQFDITIDETTPLNNNNNNNNNNTYRIKWNCIMYPPENTPYYTGQYKCCVEFPEDYPFRPIKFKFINSPFCCNVNNSGVISNEILKNDWSPGKTTVMALSVIYEDCFRYAGGLEHNIILNTERYELFDKNLPQFIKDAIDWNYKHGNGRYTSDYFEFPQISLLQYQERCQTLQVLLYEIWNIPLDIIDSIIIPFYGNSMFCCSLFNFGTLSAESPEQPEILADPDENITVEVRTLTGRKIIIETHLNEKVADFRVKLPDNSINYRNMGLIFKTPDESKILAMQLRDDKKTLYQLGVKNNSIFSIVLRCFGG